MKKNYEIKCELEDYKRTKDLLSFMKFNYSVENQTDIYYKVSKGRLKLRVINNNEANLIFYKRGNSKGKRISQYIIFPTKRYNELDVILRMQFKLLVTVIKKREIYIHKNIRIHLDSVKKLGKFLEIEIIYQNLEDAKKKMNELLYQLGLNQTKLIKTSYSDMQIKKS